MVLTMPVLRFLVVSLVSSGMCCPSRVGPPWSKCWDVVLEWRLVLLQVAGSWCWALVLVLEPETPGTYSWSRGFFLGPMAVRCSWCRGPGAGVWVLDSRTGRWSWHRGLVLGWSLVLVQVAGSWCCAQVLVLEPELSGTWSWR